MRRLREICDLTSATYLHLVASDDTLLALDTECHQGVDYVSGSHYFESDIGNIESTSNLIEFTDSQIENVIKYWTPPNPGDNSFFWGTYKTSFFRNIFDSSPELPFEASDWYFMTKVLFFGRCTRSKTIKYLRSSNAADKYVSRILPDVLKEALSKQWQLLNPVLYCIRLICEEISDECLDKLRDGFFYQIYHKYLELNEKLPDIFGCHSDLDRMNASLFFAFNVKDVPRELLLQYKYADT